MTDSLRIAPSCRVVIDNDWAGDPDGLVALAHHLLSPSNDVRLVTSSFLSPEFGPSAGTAEAGSAFARELRELLGVPVPRGIVTGVDEPFTGSPRRNEAAAAIVAEAERDDDLPLLLVCAGPLTNVADAILAHPDLVERAIIVWVGGTTSPDGFEYNRATDDPAAAFVLSATDRLIQYPLESYRTARVSVAELQHELGGAGHVGAWLWGRFVELPLPDFVVLKELWALGDSLPLLVTALGASSFEGADLRPGIRHIAPEDVRLLWGDFLAKLRLAAAVAR